MRDTSPAAETPIILKSKHIITHHIINHAPSEPD